MKKILTVLILLFMGGSGASADDAAEALAQFRVYVEAANSYSNSLDGMYAPNARIIRQVVKPDGTTANATTDKSTYMKQMHLLAVGARAKGYKNSYTDVRVTRTSNGYKVSALRQPSGETYKLQAYQVWQKQPDGYWRIVEELMQTKEQILLKYADK